jgi:hypothetical protein
MLICQKLLFHLGMVVHLGPSTEARSQSDLRVRPCLKKLEKKFLFHKE